jgi:hypothetical protein
MEIIFLPFIAFQRMTYHFTYSTESILVYCQISNCLGISGEINVQIICSFYLSQHSINITEFLQISTFLLVIERINSLNFPLELSD